MLEDIQRLFRDTWSSFREELGRREPEDELADLLSAMRGELVEARVALKELEESVRRAEEEAARERALLEQCERRAVLAERIGDEETVRVAREFAGKHRQRLDVLEQKAQALAAERELRAREAEEMRRQYQDSDRNRFSLLAQLRRARAKERMRSVSEGEEGVFADFARMEDAVERDSAYADALEELSGEGAASPPPPSPGPDLEERLRKLKERMGKE